MAWATDLLPYEIDEIKTKMPFKKNKVVHYVGTFIKEIEPFKKACNENGIRFISQHHKSMDEGRALVQESFMAPAIVTDLQQEIDYLPCRIFKNISYGQMGITTSKAAYELFKGKIVYNKDAHQLFYDAIEKYKHLKLEDIFELMDFVRDNHTYINRISDILTFMRLNYEIKNTV